MISLKCYRGFHHGPIELTPVEDIVGRVTHINLVDIFSLQHDIPGEEPACRCCFPLHRNIAGIPLQGSRYGIVAAPDPEIFPVRGKPIDQVSRILGGLALADFRDGPAPGIFIGAEECKTLIFQ